jgi:restriction system protein
VTIPTYEQLLTPLLELATHQGIVRRTVKHDMADYAGLIEEERESRIPSGRSTYIGNRTGWAMTYLKKVGLIETVAKATYRATPFGIE